MSESSDKTVAALKTALSAAGKALADQGVREELQRLGGVALSAAGTSLQGSGVLALMPVGLLAKVAGDALQARWLKALEARTAELAPASGPDLADLLASIPGHPLDVPLGSRAEPVPDASGFTADEPPIREEAPRAPDPEFPE